ncbi:hypothetical protein J8273_7435 [Carpediemonas membranifera]|uniref:Uncharacterized protein n=1 Tax=Carpediemonas membranifera TaxID=201153 RepID=A0A8J6BV84_9EUKA|nr:hypothetical protein J8273_7435 [Carpediemonas membranifera]|eukprot:KAG9391161.1 hypothetical protein J8273_7435 [Carpediemonas membranifera]
MNPYYSNGPPPNPYSAAPPPPSGDNTLYNQYSGYSGPQFEDSSNANAGYSQYSSQGPSQPQQDGASGFQPQYTSQGPPPAVPGAPVYQPPPAQYAPPPAPQNGAPQFAGPSSHFSPGGELHDPVMARKRRYQRTNATFRGLNIVSTIIFTLGMVVCVPIMLILVCFARIPFTPLFLFGVPFIPIGIAEAVTELFTVKFLDKGKGKAPLFVCTGLYQALVGLLFTVLMPILGLVLYIVALIVFSILFGN